MSAVYDREKAAGRTVKWAGAKLLVRDGNVGEFREVIEQDQGELSIITWHINGLVRKSTDADFIDYISCYDVKRGLIVNMQLTQKYKVTVVFIYMDKKAQA